MHKVTRTAITSQVIRDVGNLDFGSVVASTVSTRKSSESQSSRVTICDSSPISGALFIFTRAYTPSAPAERVAPAAAYFIPDCSPDLVFLFHLARGKGTFNLLGHFIRPSLMFEWCPGLFDEIP